MFLLSKLNFLHVVIQLVTLASLASANKYFDEPRGKDMHHYDARFFRGRVTAEKRADTLSQLIVAFLDIMDSEGIVVWLAHGTLLGWYWNGHALPW
jgi:1,4-dihydroxy-2-naphthoate octaprenyltransferase